MLNYYYNSLQFVFMGDWISSLWQSCIYILRWEFQKRKMKGSLAGTMVYFASHRCTVVMGRFNSADSSHLQWESERWPSVSLSVNQSSWNQTIWSTRRQEGWRVCFRKAPMHSSWGLSHVVKVNKLPFSYFSLQLKLYVWEYIENTSVWVAWTIGWVVS